MRQIKEVFLQSYREVTQTAGGGGALQIKLSCAIGQVVEFIHGRIVGPASAGATLTVSVYDEDNKLQRTVAVIGAGASNAFNFPSLGESTGEATGGTPPSDPIVVGSGAYLLVDASAAAQNEKLTMAYLAKTNMNASLTYSHAGSAGTPSGGTGEQISSGNRLVVVAK